MSPPLPLSLVVFAYNEADNVPTVLPEVLCWLVSRAVPFELIFVDDGSTDGTGRAAEAVLAGRPEAKVITHPSNRGIGAALKTGVAAATLPWVSFLPGSGRIAPDALDALVEAAIADRVSVVFSVYRDRGWDGRLISAGIRGLIWGLFQVAVQSDGPYLFRRELFDPLELVPDTVFLNVEFPIRMVREKVPTTVVTIPRKTRRSGRPDRPTGVRRTAAVARDLVSLRLRLSLGHGR